MKVKNIYNDWFQIANLITQHVGIWNCILVEYDAYKQNMIYTIQILDSKFYCA